MYLDFKKVTTVSSLGGGPIGAGWAAHFLSKGYKVKSYIHDINEQASFEAIVKTAWISLQEIGVDKSASLNNLLISTNLEEVLHETHFVQESIPEILELKCKFYQILGNILPKRVIIASSTSGLTMTEIQKLCSTPERTVIGHPFNPPYLLPLVEIVGGRKSAAEAVKWAFSFYKYAGKEPLVMEKEIPGFVANRLQEALWREALWRVWRRACMCVAVMRGR